MLGWGQGVGMFPQSLLHQKQVMQCGNDGKPSRRVEERYACDPNPALRVNFQQHHKENCGDLAQGIRFTKNTGTEVPQSGNREQHGARCQDGNVTAEYQDCVLPRNLVQDRKHKEYRAQ